MHHHFALRLFAPIGFELSAMLLARLVGFVVEDRAGQCVDNDRLVGCGPSRMERSWSRGSRRGQELSAGRRLARACFPPMYGTKSVQARPRTSGSVL